MLINNWYVAALAEEVTADKPLGVRMLGLDFVLFRDSAGQAVCLSDVCCHRGGALSDGQLNDGCVACPYHGWEFAPSGRCALIPSAGESARIPKRARIDTYPTEERYGWIWVFLGDLPEAERPAVPELFPEFHDQETWRVIPYSFQARCNWIRMEENSLDTIHTTFVHPMFGGKVDTQSANQDIELTEYGARVDREKFAPGSDAKTGAMAEMLSEDRERTRVNLEFSLIGVTHRINPTFKKGMGLINFTARTPVDAFNTRAFGWQARNFLTDPSQDAERLKAINQAISEDVAIVEKVKPALMPPSLPEEFLTKADSMEVAFRRLVKQHADRGWEIDLEAFEAESRYSVLVIPSPDRREDPKGWVHKTVPLRPAARVARAGNE